jgi:hypothetical protein
MSFLRHIQVIILPENLSQNKSEEENEKKTKDPNGNFYRTLITVSMSIQFQFQ